MQKPQLRLLSTSPWVSSFDPPCLLLIYAQVLHVNNWQICFTLEGYLVKDADAAFNGNLSLFLQVKSTYWQAVKAWHSHTVGNSTSL